MLMFPSAFRLLCFGSRIESALKKNFFFALIFLACTCSPSTWEAEAGKKDGEF